MTWDKLADRIDNFYLDESRLEFETDSRNTDDVY